MEQKGKIGQDMEQKKDTEQVLVCSTVKDLLPMYVDQMTSKESNRAIEKHLDSCVSCQSVLEQMRQPIMVETAPEVKDFKKYLKRSRFAVMQWIMGAAGGIAILTCFIVNLAVEKHLSWFYIVLMGILTAYVPAYLGLKAEKRRFVSFLAALTVCVPFLVGVVQMVLYQYMDQKDIWFFRLGVPIMLIWFVILWISVSVHEIFHKSWVLAVGVLLALAVFGDLFTNLICREYQSVAEYMENFVSHGLGNTIAAVVVLLIGLYMQKRQKKNL